MTHRCFLNRISLPSSTTFTMGVFHFDSGPPRKAHRTNGRAAGVTARLTAIPEHESAPYLSSRTPVRSSKQHRRPRSQVLARETDSSSVSRNEEDADGERPYSPPSPYSLPSSPSPPHSPSYGEHHDSFGHSPKRRKTKDVDIAETRGSLGAVNSQGKETGSYWTSPMKTPSRSSSRAEDHLTTTSTPPSASRYKRALDPSQLEPGRTPNRRDVLMDQFEETYWSLKTTPPGEVTNGALGLKPSAQTDDMDELYSPLAADLGSQSSHPFLSPGPQQRSHVLMRAPPGLHLTVTSSDGARVYLRVKPGSKYEGRGEVSSYNILRKQLYRRSM